MAKHIELAISLYMRSQAITLACKHIKVGDFLFNENDPMPSQVIEIGIEPTQGNYGAEMFYFKLSRTRYNGMCSCHGFPDSPAIVLKLQK